MIDRFYSAHVQLIENYACCHKFPYVFSIAVDQNRICV